MGIPLSTAHNPSLYEERMRIQKAGGHVKYEWDTFFTQYHTCDKLSSAFKEVFNNTYRQILTSNDRDLVKTADFLKTLRVQFLVSPV